MAGKVRLTAVLGWTAFAMSCPWLVLALVVAIINLNHDTDYNTILGIGSFVNLAIAAVSFTFLGALILSREPANRAGLILLTPAFYPVSIVLDIVTSVGADPAAGWVYWLGDWLRLAAIAPTLTLLPFLLPDGRFASRRWRLVFFFSAGVTVVFIAQHAVLAYLFFYHPGFDYSPSQLVDVLTGVLMLLFLICAAAGIVSLVARVYTARGRERSQLLWVLLGTSVFVVTPLTVQPMFAGIGSSLQVLDGRRSVPNSRPRQL